MRISEIKLQCEDIMWFATDNQGNIFECTSAGCGNVPEYVCRSQEETDALLEYFSEEAPVVTTSKLMIPKEDNDLVKDILDLSSKGIYCFDVTDIDDDEKYNLIAAPENAIHLSDLPAEIQDLLKDHYYSGNVAIETTISVEHAY